MTTTPLTSVTCPECGTTTEIDTSRRGSTEFCPRCDYPLFWARLAHQAVAPDDLDNDTATRRLPGTGGMQVIGHRNCPHCGERNSLSARFCIRCAGDMDPQPEPVLVAAPPAPEPVYEEPVPEPRPWWPWPLIIVAIVVILLAIFL